MRLSLRFANKLLPLLSPSRSQRRRSRFPQGYQPYLPSKPPLMTGLNRSLSSMQALSRYSHVSLFKSYTNQISRLLSYECYIFRPILLHSSRDTFHWDKPKRNNLREINHGVVWRQARILQLHNFATSLIRIRSYSACMSNWDRRPKHQ